MQFNIQGKSIFGNIICKEHIFLEKFAVYSSLKKDQNGSVDVYH